MALATLSIDLEARLAGLQQGFDKAARLAEKNASTIEARYNRLASAATAVGAAIAGAFTVGTLVTFFRATVDGIDALNDLADATGSSIENLSALEDAAARTGTSLDTVGGALVKLNQTLAGAKEGSAAADALKRLGLNAEELRRLDPAEALQRTAVALADFADDGNKARLVQELFGKSVREVAPLLKDLVEVGKLTATVTTEQAEAASKFNKQLSSLSKEATDLARDLSGPLVRGLNDFFDALNRARRSDSGILGTFGETLQADFLRARLVATNEELERLAPAAQRAQDILARQPDSIRASAVLADFAEVSRAADEYRRKIDDVMGYARGARRPANEGGGRVNIDLPTVGDPSGKPKGPERTKPTDFAGTPLDPLTAAALKRLEETDTQKLGQLRLELLALLELGGDTQFGNQGEALRRLREELAKLDPEQQKIAESRKRLNDLLATTPSGQLGGLLRDLEVVNSEFSQGAITIEQWAEAVRSTLGRLPQDIDPQKLVQLRQELQGLLDLSGSRGGSVEQWGEAVRSTLGLLPQDINPQKLVQLRLELQNLLKLGGSTGIGIEQWSEAVRSTLGRLPQDIDPQKLVQLRIELQDLLELGGSGFGGNQGDAVRRLREELAKLDPEYAKLADSRKRLDDLLANTPSGQLGGVLSDIELINSQFAKGTVTVEQWAEVVRATTARLPQDTEKALDEISEFTRQFQRNIQNVLGDNIASVLRGDFDSIEDAWKTMLLNMVAQATAADLATRLFGKDGKSGYAAQLFGFLGFAKGGAFNSSGQSITAFADGGVLNRPTFFGMSGGRMGVAGEAGTEGVFPLERGPDGKLGVKAYGGGGDGVTNIYYVDAGVSRADLISALQLMSQQTEARIMSKLAARRVI